MNDEYDSSKTSYQAKRGGLGSTPGSPSDGWYGYWGQVTWTAWIQLPPTEDILSRSGNSYLLQLRPSRPHQRAESGL